LGERTPIAEQRNWTLEAWIDPASLDQAGIVAYNGDRGAANGFGFGVFGQNGEKGGCLAGLYELVTWINSGYCFPKANQWYHVAETNSEGTVTFYVDGSQVFQAAEPTPYAPSGTMIGGYGATSERNFFGRISNVAFYPAALGAATIGSHYAAAQGTGDGQSRYSAAVKAYYETAHGLPFETHWGVGPATRPFTDLTADQVGGLDGAMAAQGNGLQAGIGSLETFEASFTANFVVATAGEVTFDVTSEDGFLLGIGGGATRVSGPYETPPESNQSPFQGLPLVAAFNKACCTTPQTYAVTVHFPAPGSYPYELDYFQHGGAQLSLVMATATLVPDTSPLSVYAGYADSARPASGIFPYPWQGSPTVTNFIGKPLGEAYDSGAVRFDNTSASPITLEDVSVGIGPEQFDLWGQNIEVKPHGITILTETEGVNFDTSDAPSSVCTPDGIVPRINVTSEGTRTTYNDTAQILNTGGVDPAICDPVGSQNESRPWSRIGGEGTPINVPLPPAVSLELTPTMISGDQVGQTQQLAVSAHDASGKAVSGLAVDLHVYGPNGRDIPVTTNSEGAASASYIGKNAGQDIVSATASIEGMQTASNQLTVPWAVPAPPEQTSGSSASGIEPPSVEIERPIGNSFITATQAVTGFVAGEHISAWTLKLIPAGGGLATTLGSGTAPASHTLGTIEAAKFGEGSYTLELRAETPGGTATETEPLTIGITPGVPPPPLQESSSGAPALSDERPSNGAVVGVPTAVSAKGTAPSGQTIAGWKVTLTPLGSSTAATIGETSAEHPSTLATIEPSKFQSGTYTLSITVTASGGGYATAYATVTLGTGVATTSTSTTTASTTTTTSSTASTTTTESTATSSTTSSTTTTSSSETTTTASSASVPAAPPSISSLSPAEGTIVRTPVPITAQIQAPEGEAIASWSLSYQGAEPSATTIAAGSGAPPEALGTFDPTRLPNGTYRVTVLATTTRGAVQSESVSLIVSGNLKLGRFLQTYKDLEVPVSGFTMALQRVYDSTDKSSGDFGVGWHLLLSNFKVQTNGPLGKGGWTRNQTHCAFGEQVEGGLGEEAGGVCASAYQSSPKHTVTVTWPDQHTEVLVFEAHGELFNLVPPQPAFTPEPGTNTTSTLEPAEPEELLYGGDGNLYEGALADYWNATHFILTTRTGQKLVLSTESGLVSEEDRNHNKLTVTPEGIQSSAGPKLTFKRDSQGRITEAEGPSGQHLHYGYDAAGDLTSYTDADGNTTTYAYDSNHDLLTTTGPGASHPLQTLRYDAEGRLEEVIDAEGHATKVSTNVGARTETIADPNGKLTTIDTYDELGNPIEEVKAAESKTLTTKHTYDAEGHLLSTTDPEGHTTSYTYDSAGDLTSETRPQGEKRTIAYGPHGEPTTITEPGGALIKHVYDAQGNLVSSTDADGNVTSYEYDSLGHKIATIDPLGHKTTYAYTPSGQVASETNSGGHTTSYTYDASGKLLTSTNPLGQSTANEYDAEGRLVAS
ncbi:MAG: LamG-like jellyroll fold domain-containing protein, partial [Solirubrobacteraceae bacterium]